MINDSTGGFTLPTLVSCGVVRTTDPPSVNNVGAPASR